jgi:hypothetical protein
MKNNRIAIFMGIGLLVFSSLACSLSGLIPGIGGSGDGAGTVADLWPDVPKMGGMTPIKQDMPLQVRLMVQTFFAAASENQGSLNFIAYSTDKTASDVVDLYSAERMKTAGWDLNDLPGCIADTSSTVSQGGVCLYGKQSKDNSTSLLAIVPSVDSSTKKTNIFFARIDVKEAKTPTPQ